MSHTCTWLEFVLRLTVLKKLVSAPGLWSPATFEVMATNFMVARMRVQGDHAAQMYQVCGSWVHVGAPGDGAGLSTICSAGDICDFGGVPVGARSQAAGGPTEAFLPEKARLFGRIAEVSPHLCLDV